ncbi:MAG: efflux RND transporter periplasmic adaptor subunit [Pseudoxanthomonas sp.]
MTTPLRSLALASAVLVALAACGKQDEQPQMPPPEVGVITAQPQTIPLVRDLVGRLTPYRSADVRARVPGWVLKRTYKEGTQVKQGDVLFQLDPAPMQAELRQAQGQLASAEATAKNAKVVAERARSLAPQQYVSRADIDQAEANERSASASVQQARGAVENARINLSFTSVIAPISGRAGQQRVTEGALVGQGDTTLLTTVDQTDPLYVNFQMSAEELQSLRAAQGEGGVSLSDTQDATVKILMKGGKAYPQDGRLDFSDVVVDQATGAISLRATVPNPNTVLLPGTFVTVEANLGSRSNVFLIPQAAIQRDTSGPYALVVGQENKVVRKEVQMESRALDGKWIVTGGLAAGDKVIGVGLQKAKEDAQVKPIPYEQALAQMQQQGQAKKAPAGAAADKPAEGQAAPQAEQNAASSEKPASGQAE